MAWPTVGDTICSRSWATAPQLIEAYPFASPVNRDYTLSNAPREDGGGSAILWRSRCTSRSSTRACVSAARVGGDAGHRPSVLLGGVCCGRGRAVSKRADGFVV